METIQIKTWNTQKVIFEYKAENPTLRDAVKEAVRQNISLEWANLEGADLNDANLNWANLSNANLEGADLKGTNFSGANLESANLFRADLFFADLNEAKLIGANLYNAFIYNADLHKANLEGADLRSADLIAANLKWANLSNANLEGADLRDADLKYADLSGANFESAKFQNVHLYRAIGIPDDLMSLACPAEGSFIAWKKVYNKLVKLEIPEEAKRSSATTNKCRCSKAKVLAITDLGETKTFEEVVNENYAPLTYKVGEMVYPDSFDENRWNECSHGIHFFMDKVEAINW